MVDDIERARVALRDRLRVATTVGLGPRFLHSTGQLHKGGPDTGVFVQVVGDDADDDVPSPARRTGSPRSSTRRPTATCSPCTTASAGPAAWRLTELVEVAP